MKAYLPVVASLLIASSSHAQSPVTEKQVIEYSKSIDVKTLDQSLPSQRLEDWLRSGPPKAELLQWQSDDTCDIRPFADGDYPRCVRITFGRGGQSGYFLVQIGTFHKGIIGSPQLYEGIGVQEPAFIQTGWTERLSGIPHLLDQPTVAGDVNDFYNSIVQRKPIGIPGGADKASLWPFLSRRLVQKLETARACQADYILQHHDADAIPKPAWLNTGIFVGNSKRAFPQSSVAVKKEPLQDGAFAVTVNLTYVKLPGFVPDEAAWEIVPTVIPEDNRFVIDDVRLFDGLDTNGPSHLLSETFLGCDGAHWTGEHVTDMPPASLPGPHYTDWNAVNNLRSATYNEELTFAKTINVHELDPSLPSQQLKDWLTSLHFTHLTWDGLKCNIKEGQHGPEGEYLVARNPDGGLCAQVWFNCGNARTSIEISSPHGRFPASVKMYVQDKDDGLLSPMIANSEKPSDSNRLSDLPRLLKEQGVVDVTRGLYDAIVASHPLGVPRGQDMVRIGHLLSTRLRKQLESAQGCQNDYLHQRPRPPEKPDWFNAGLFSGEGKLALPTAALVDHKELQEGSSFQVRVSLSRHEPSAPAFVPPIPGWKTWHVSTIVRLEDGKFVVDDVRLFSNDSADGPSRLLSDSFTGCNGPHWVGTTVATR
jgi:hypothetical protein